MDAIAGAQSKRLLLVEDSVSFAFAIKVKIEKETGLEIVLVKSLAEAKHAYEKFDGDFFLALVKLTLLDAGVDAVLDFFDGRMMPTVAFTGTYSDAYRDAAFAKSAIDYVSKDTPRMLEYLAALVKRLWRNSGQSVLVVDDSTATRLQISSLLRMYRLTVFEASDADEALAVMGRETGVRLVITDYNMPGMSGPALVSALRRTFGEDRVAIIGVSGDGGPSRTARFLKAGANDFLKKPFSGEEFFCRVNQNLQHLDAVRALTELATTDPLTKARNRRSFFEVSEPLLAQATRAARPSSVAMIDIDFFKTVNDTHGHLVGDAALAHVAGVVSERFQRASDVFARFGGEEFCLLMGDVDAEDAFSILDGVRARVAESPLEIDGRAIPLTVSIGVATGTGVGLSDLLSEADAALYRAKADGRNRTVASDPKGPAEAPVDVSGPADLAVVD